MIYNYSLAVSLYISYISCTLQQNTLPLIDDRCEWLLDDNWVKFTKEKSRLIAKKYFTFWHVLQGEMYSLVFKVSALFIFTFPQ